MPDPASFVTVVSGLPRSGTSMMMRMLEAGGLPPLTDRERRADEDNPRGYYELEAVKALPGDQSWLPAAAGHAVKVIYKLVYRMPPSVDLRMIFLERDLREVLASQQKMLERSGTREPVSADALLPLFQRELAVFRKWAAAQPNILTLYVDYREAVSDPGGTAERIRAFLGLPLDVQAMAAAVEADLYRNRAG